MIRVLIVDDQRVLREGLKAILEQQEDISIVGTAADGKAAIENVQALKPDVVLMDLLMPVIDGLAATRAINQRFPETKVLILSGCEDDSSLENSLRVGAKGYLLKNTSSEDIAAAVRSVYRGNTQFSPGVLDKLVSKLPTTEVSNLILAEEFHPDFYIFLSRNQAFEGLIDDCLSMTDRLNQLSENFTRVFTLPK
jgi:DNA-binding NarL/FixJ family response regulator